VTTLYIAAFGDVYEVTFDPQSVRSIVRYRRCDHSQGEFVSFDNLHPQVQDVIYTKLARALQDGA